jgi:hypothetical protein
MRTLTVIVLALVLVAVAVLVVSQQKGGGTKVPGGGIGRQPPK